MRRVGAALAVVVAAVVVAPRMLPVASASSADLGAGGEFHPLDAQRIFDTRSPGVNDVAPLGAKPISAAGSTFDIALLGQGGVPADAADVLGVMISVTVWNGPSAGNLGAYPTGLPPASPTSFINLIGAPVTNTAIVRAGSAGNLTIRLQGGTVGAADISVDVLGWLSTTASGATGGTRLVAAGPKRIADTRLGAASPLGVGASLAVNGRGAQALDDLSVIVPDNPAIAAVMVNVTLIRPAAPTSVSVQRTAPAAPPTIANAHVGANLVKANLVVVPLDANGDFHLYNSTSAVHVAVDVVGYFIGGQPGTSRAGRMVPLAAPYRTFDTREAQWGAVALGPGQRENWSFAAFAGSVTIDGETAGAQQAVFGNLTAVRLVRQYPTVPVTGYLTAYPAGLPATPVVSNLNTNELHVVPNMTLLRYGANTEVVVYNHTGFSHYLFDAFAIVLSD